MSNSSFKVKNSLNIEPIAGAAPTAEGDLAYNLSTNKLSIHNGSSASPLVTEAHTATLTNKTLTAPVISTISNTGTLTLPTSTDTLVGRATTDTLTNKTLTAPVISTISNTGTLTLPTSTDTLVGRDTTDTLTNKTISGASNTITNVSLTSGVTGTLPVTNGGTGLSTIASTAVPFASAADTLTADANKISFITASNRFYVGAIGIATGQLNSNATNASNLALYVAHTSANVAVINSQSTYINTLHTHSDNTAGNGTILSLQRARGTTGSRTQAQSGDLIACIQGNAYINSSTVTTHGTAGICFYLDENAQASSCGGSLRMFTTPTGTITPKERLRLQQDGSLEFAGATSGYVAIIPPATVTSHTLTLPSAQGAANTTLINNGSGTLSWSTIANANVTASAAIALNKLAATTASRALVSDGSGFVSASSVTDTELGYVSGVTSAIQTQINALSPVTSVNQISNLGLTATVGASALTIAVKQADGSTNPSSGSGAVLVGMRSSTLTSGLYNQRSITSSLSMTVSSGSTLGHTSGDTLGIYVYLLDNAGTLELAVSSILYADFSIVSTTAEGGAGAADTNYTIYSTTARSNVPIRCIAKLVSNQATAGTWATAISDIQLGTYSSLAAADTTAIFAYKNSSTTYNSNAARQQILIDTVLHDSKAMLSSNTIVIPQDGFYDLNAKILWTGANMSSGATYDAVITSSSVGGTIIAFDEQRCPAAGAQVTNTLTSTRFLTAGTVLYFSANSSANHSVNTVTIDGTASFWTYITVKKV